MADINIQRKKSSPSPWLLVLLVLAVLGAIAWYLLRNSDSTSANQNPVAAPTSSAAESTTDTTTGAETGPRPSANQSVEDMDTEPAPVTPEVLAAFAKTDPSQPSYAREGLRLLTASLVDLADRDNLRDPAIGEKRDGLTSATARLGEPNTSLRPGLVAAAGLMQAMQQKAFPGQEAAVADLLNRANQLSGRNETPTDHQQLQEFFTRAAEVVRTFSEQPS